MGCDPPAWRDSAKNAVGVALGPLRAWLTGGGLPIWGWAVFIRARVIVVCLLLVR